jgi:hypothetical protein
MPLHALHCITVLPYRLFTVSLPHNCIANQQNHLTSLFCIFFSHQVLCLIIMDSSSSLAVSSMCSSSVGVMLRFLSFSGSRNSLSTLSVTTSQLWLLWLLSPFLHMITGGDHTPGLNEHLSAYQFNDHDSFS